MPYPTHFFFIPSFSRRQTTVRFLSPFPPHSPHFPHPLFHFSPDLSSRFSPYQSLLINCLKPTHLLPEKRMGRRWVGDDKALVRRWSLEVADSQRITIISY
ncbi:MAG: hypothetical protein IJU19_05620 [Bacteroidales bacterium]|nr:hypothetical protein [Bacteroidales bacterium]